MSKNRERGDLRVRRTRKLLRESLMALVEEKGYESVSVAEIAGRAMVNRATFYSHYRDKYDLLLDILGETLGVISINRNLVPESLEEPPEAMVRFLEHVGTHPGFYRGVLGEGGSKQVKADARTYLEGIVRQWLRAISGEEKSTRAPFEFVAGYAAAAMLGTVSWWLENDTPYPPEKMAAWFVETLAPGVHHALGLPVPSLPSGSEARG